MKKAARSHRRTGVLAMCAAGALVLGTPLAAQAAEFKYANQVTTSENQLRSSLVRAAGLTGGKATAYVGNSITTIQTRSGSTYAVLASAQGTSGGWANLSHSNIANTWSSCYWKWSTGSGSSLKIDCYYKY